MRMRIAKINHRGGTIIIDLAEVVAITDAADPQTGSRVLNMAALITRSGGVFPIGIERDTLAALVWGKEIETLAVPDQGPPRPSLTIAR